MLAETGSREWVPAPFLLPCNVLPDLPVGKTKAKATRQKDIRKADLGVLGREGQKWDLRRNRHMASTQRRHPFTDSPSSPTFGTAPRGKLNQFSVYQFHDPTILKIFFLFQTSLGINLNNRSQHFIKADCVDGWINCSCSCCCLVIKSCLTLCDLHGLYSPPGSSVHGDSPDKNTRVSCHALLQGDVPDPGIKHLSPAWQADSLPLSHLGSPLLLLDVA